MQWAAHAGVMLKHKRKSNSAKLLLDDVIIEQTPVDHYRNLSSNGIASLPERLFAIQRNMELL